MHFILAGKFKTLKKIRQFSLAIQLFVLEVKKKSFPVNKRQQGKKRIFEVEKLKLFIKMTIGLFTVIIAKTHYLASFPN